MLPRLSSLAIGYVLGWFATGYLYAKSKGVDIRTKGSGNIGMTNTLRNLGLKAGLITLLGDAGKAALAIFLSWLLFHQSYPDQIRLFMLYAGFGAILGHNFPLPMKFKGGKGIACTVGLIAAFAWWELPISIGLFLLALALTRYVSLGSILIVTSFFIQTLIFALTLRPFGNLTTGEAVELLILAALVMVLGIVRHRENIGRLIAGKENKFSLHPKVEKN
ncbi:MAG: glycerol-3-phosphate 1-O-acyltransferase PlsY [Lachnospiraceae bacterium]|nr:glycerol-3-phosphate 1-O-acyltransferase PlsY [Lachnospiraceae bacterium]